ncbi:MAG: hypothetical protein DRP64_01365 [Verrucomicrobia bacterium]|nr:MAG: hypothetical protein DRP64_01365 [Verrucomicrobiota bacterium]
MLIDIKSSRGYANPDYAQSLAEFGEPVHLPRSGGNLLKRRIPGTSCFDAMGCYPMFFCEDWAGLNEDLGKLPGDIVSVSIVADPFGAYSRQLLEECFDIVNPFKSHYVVDLERGAGEIGTEHHRKAARRALRKVRVEVCKDPAGFVDGWFRLYGNLVQRYGIHGIRAFSRTAFSRQLSMAEIIVHQAFLGDEIVGAQLFFVQDGVAHCHLGAVSEAGYKAGAFYALDFFSFEYFVESARKLDLGGGVGLSSSSGDGLSHYKSGWASETRPVYFCGRIINPDRYAALAPLQGKDKIEYFPAYRIGEFG